MSVMNVLRQHKGVAGLVFANIGVAVSLLVGAFQFVTTYEQTRADVEFLHAEFDQMVRQGELDELHQRMEVTQQESSFVAERVTVLETQRDEGRDKEGKLDEAQRDIQLLRERLAEFDSRFQSMGQSGFDAEDLRQRIADLQVVIGRLETRMNQSDQDRYKLDELDDRLDRLDDFVIRWDEQSSMIMAEHEQFSEIIKEVWEAIGERGTVPAGTGRSYGYD
jgi:DNA repair ATPase RecN